ncbi:MAG: M28 family metallopeptidase [Acholeplasmataceae bacterium]
MKNKICTFIQNKNISIVILLLVLLVSLFVLDTPKPKDRDVSGFSAVRVSEHIKEISKKPHSYYDQDELEEVRVYIEDTLSNYLDASNVSRMGYSLNEMENVLGDKLRDEDIYPLENILGVLPGENSEGILLIAHFDSRGHIGRANELGGSYGAMDDGYGVGTLLELAYLFKDKDIKNSIYFLFTDAEEVGLYGAYMAANDNYFKDKIKMIINVESRGSSGPAYMFETSKNNKRLIDLYQHASYPVTYSMATAVYSVMPNFTDFTPFVDNGYIGLNFANLEGIKSYHTPFDRYEFIDFSTIQHFGSQIEPILNEFVSNSKYIEDHYFKSNEDHVFFTILPNVLIKYSDTLAKVFSILLLVLFGALLFFYYKDNLNKNLFKKLLPKMLLFAGGMVVISLVYSYLVAFLGKVDFKITYVRVLEMELPTIILFGIITYFAAKKIIKSNFDQVLIIGISINLLLALLTSFTLTGASFLFFITALLGSLSLFVSKFNYKYLKHVTYILSYSLMLFLILPILYSFYLALTVGGAAILMVLYLISLSTFLPIILKQFTV